MRRELVSYRERWRGGGGGGGGGEGGRADGRMGGDLITGISAVTVHSAVYICRCCVASTIALEALIACQI